MKTYFYLSLLLLFPLTLWANNEPEHAAVKGSLKGKLIDPTTSEPIPYATISLQQEEKNITGGISDESGNFVIKNISKGKYEVLFQFMGYETHQLTLDFVKGSMNINLGEVGLSPSKKLLEEVTVEGQRVKIEQQLGKKVVNITPELAAGHTNISDVLQQVPDINIDGEGNISLRGDSNVRVLIDNKPTQLSPAEALKSLPPNLVERVDVITNPSAKYDPEGISGIINIITKKNRIQGFNGMVRGGVGTGDKYNGGMNFNYRVGKFNVFAEANFSKERWNHERGFERTFEESGALLKQDQEIFRNQGFQQYKGGLDYFIDSVNTLSGYYQYFKWESTSNQPFTQSLEQAGLPTIFRNGKGFSENMNEGHQFDLNYRREIKDGYLETDLWYMDGHGFFNSANTQKDETGGVVSQNNNNLFTFNIFVPTLDFSKNISEKAKIELGYKGEYTDAFSNSTNNNGEENVDFGYDYYDMISAVYTTFSTQIKNMEVQAGLRAEHALQQGTIQLSEGDTPFTNEYFSLFPTLSLQQKLGEKANLGFSYSRRVRRPNIDEIAPFEVYENPQNIQRGNPDLKPSFTNSMELSYGYRPEKFTISTSAYVRLGNDIIRSYSFFEEESQANVTTSQNLGSVETYGVSVSGDVNITKWWNLSGGIDLTHIDFNDTTYTIPNRPDLNLSAKLNATFMLPWNLKIIANGNYDGNNYGLQNVSNPFYAMSMTVSKDILEKKGNISFRAQNLIYSGWSNNVYGLGFHEENYWNSENPVFYLNFSYRFGNMKARGRKRSIHTQKSL
ncbi:TonB-dependent receptor domain-containing protein [Persicobacter diffluens]|uniref:TonB-dependent receptor n=1 Tax=Persicobacter diffluens TaxID=981 RepID=A0AAN5ALZ9_9BACT|nr:TonB-dependent receptor [Persicobacter diffluens]